MTQPPSAAALEAARAALDAFAALAAKPAASDIDAAKELQAELIAALRACLDVFDDHGPHNGGGYHIDCPECVAAKRARAALAKAEERS